METTVIKIGNSLAFKVPEVFIKDFNLKADTKIRMDFKRNGNLVLQKKSKVREGWDSAFSLYAIKGEDKLMLPDFIDYEIDTLL